MEVAGKLWAIAAKVSGVGFLLKHQDVSAEPPGEFIFYGTGQLLMDIGSDIECVREEVESGA